MFEWEQVEKDKEVTPKYEIIFFKENETIDNGLFTVQTITNRVKINHVKLNEIAEKAGIEAGNSGSINWTVIFPIMAQIQCHLKWSTQS